MLTRFLSLPKTIVHSLETVRNLFIIQRSGLFNSNWYLEHNPDVKQAKQNAMLHYLRHGGLEGRDPGPRFSSRYYLQIYDDVKKSGMNPLVHYLRYGQREGRLIQPEAPTRHAEAASPSYECSVCKNPVAAFVPLSSFYLENTKKYGYPYTFAEAETLNSEQYTCPYCGASDRDRLYACYLDRKLSQYPTGQQLDLLDIAPSVQLGRFINRLENVVHHTGDLLLEGVDFSLDITNMPEIKSNSYDILICSHVLEHVSDDRKALAELYRVLKPGGWGIIMVPIILTLDQIDEDPQVIDVAERWRRFGQYDHVRLYNKHGFVERVEAAGFQLKQLGVDYFGESIFRRYGITNQSVLYIAEKVHESRFRKKLFHLISENSYYEYPENDFGAAPRFHQAVRIVDSPSIRSSIQERAFERLNREYDVNGLEFAYNILGDEYSKEMLLKVITARLMGLSHVRFPLYYSHIWKFYDLIDGLRMDNASLKVGPWDFYTYELGPIGFDLRLQDNKMGTFICYVLEQYKYKNVVFAREGDFIIDGGACYGDTCLYFADLIKEQGKVFSFEFIGKNLDLLYRNVALNPTKQNNIKVIEKPLWSASEIELVGVDSGSASHLLEATTNIGDQVYKTICIDDFVKKNNIEKINFIKLDIEGAELAALKGAVETIRRHTPQLAVCLYHKNSDFWEIPRFLHEIVPDYKFYLDHFSLDLYETVLFATANAQPSEQQ